MKNSDALHASSLYAKYVVGLLFLVNLFNIADRLVLGIVLEPLKHDLGLSDTQLGFLTGLAFASVYATLALPLARVADKWNRRSLIAISMAVWSLASALCGFARNYVELLTARMGVAAGEAGFSPSAHSIIADYVRPERRAAALAFFAFGGSVGILAGNAIGGFTAETYGWRFAFVAIATPGLFLAAIVRLTVKEPIRGGNENRPSASEDDQSNLRGLLAKKSYRFLILGAAAHLFVSYGIVGWIPSFFLRMHDIGLAELGLWLGLITAISGGIGVLGGGLLSDRLALVDRRWLVWIPAISVVAAVPFALGMYLSAHVYIALAWAAVMTIFSQVYQGPTYALVQTLAPVRMRSSAAAVMIFVQNMVGLGLGPAAVGVLSDFLTPSYGVRSLQIALIAMFFVNVLSSLFFFLAGRHLLSDLTTYEDNDPLDHHAST